MYEYISIWDIGIRNRDTRVDEIVPRELEKVNPDKWGYVQVHNLWSSKEERQVHPRHFWILKFTKVTRNNNCVELLPRVDVWLYRVDEDDSGLTFEEWDPSEDTDVSQAPVTMIVKSSEFHTEGFDLREVIPLQLESVDCGGRWTCGTVLNQIHGMDTRRHVLSVDNENEFRSRCEWFGTKTRKKSLKIKKHVFLWRKHFSCLHFFCWMIFLRLRKKLKNDQILVGCVSHPPKDPCLARSTFKTFVFSL